MAKQKLTPFTVEHFQDWARGLVLDNGQPWEPEPFQLAFVADLFSGVGQAWLVVPEANGKTTLMAGLALYFLEFSEQPAEIPIAAASRDQALHLYGQAEGFVLRSEQLYEQVPSQLQQRKGKLKLIVPRFMPQSGNREIRHFRGGRIKVFAADERTGDGVLFTLAIIDELHRHRDLRLYRTWDGKRLKRGGQIVAISTAGDPGGEFELAREALRQKLPELERRPTFLRAGNSRICLHEWALPEEGDPEDIALVKEANPFSGITLEKLQEKFDSEIMTLAHWRRFTCNLPTRADLAAITESEWAAVRGEEQIPAGVPIAVGLDVGWKGDPTAIVPFYMPTWERRLFGPAIELVPPRDGNHLDPHLIERALLELQTRNPISRVVMDMHRAETLATWIEEELGAAVTDRQQGNAFQCLDFERFMEGLRQGYIVHSGDEVLTRHALNAVAHLLPDGRTKFERPSRSRDGSENLRQRRVIDALVAAAMVHSHAVGEWRLEEPEVLFAAF
jgi:phage terminase large subunit-like protein